MQINLKLTISIGKTLRVASCAQTEELGTDLQNSSPFIPADRIEITKVLKSHLDWVIDKKQRDVIGCHSIL